MKGIYILGGYPDRGRFVQSMRAVAEAGADFIEVGIPFNDPVADGPVIAGAAMETANSGITVEEILEDMESCRRSGVRLFAMTYCNIIYRYGIARFSERCRGLLEGVILADLPNRMHSFFYERGLDLPIIPFVTLESRGDDIVSASYSPGSFVYFIGLRGITGATADFESTEMTEQVVRVRQHTGKRVVIGFGIKNGDDARRALALADGFVVGTEAVRRQGDLPALREYLEGLLQTVPAGDH
ncbi:MAG: tryptophan synthase subunit alpha [Spirochaetes bacterium]|nr:tryptophan synthase subunit alpha [Spirochaetota bacterium]